MTILVYCASKNESKSVDQEVKNEMHIILLCFVFTWWIYSVCFHEFGHALFAYLGGDKSVVDEGYLYLDPVKYVDPYMTFIIPLVLFLFCGGLPLFGGAVHIHKENLRSRCWCILVDLGGLIGTLVFLFFNLLPLWILCTKDNISNVIYNEHEELSWSETYGRYFILGIASLAYCNLKSVFINILPIPPLDGFQLIYPCLPEEFKNWYTQKCNNMLINCFAFILLYCISSSIFFIEFVQFVANLIGIPPSFIV